MLSDSRNADYSAKPNISKTRLTLSNKKRFFIVVKNDIEQTTTN
jgi:hypothetical protein